MISRASRQQGFVLALTLWILAIIAIVTGYFAEKISRDIELARQALLNIQVMQGLADTRAEILFRLGTQPMSLYGLGRGLKDSVALDDRSYLGSGGTVVRLQDNRGLYNLNFASPDSMARLLGVLGVPSERQATLIDTLLDYTDEDDLRRLNGAEKSEYEAQGLPPPRNDRLITPYEARRVFGWSEEKPLWENDRLPRLATTSTAFALNPNTAPWQVLATLPGVTDEIAKKIIAQRQIQPFTSGDQIASLSGIPLQQFDMLRIIVLPSDSLRITQTAPGLPWAVQYSVTLTPNAKEGPWRIDYFYQTGLTNTDESLADIPALPEASPLPTSTTPSLFSTP